METEGRDGIRRGGLWREQHFSRRGLRGGWNWVSRETRVGPRRPRARRSRGGQEWRRRCVPGRPVSEVERGACACPVRPPSQASRAAADGVITLCVRNGLHEIRFGLKRVKK